MCTFNNEGELLLFQNQGSFYNCEKIDHCANKCTSKRINNSNSKITKGFKVIVQLVDSKDIQQKTFGPERKTKAKDHQIKRNLWEKRWTFLLRRK
jgi:hypothetical protein